ncbi:MAG: threonylcarbamoyl-AMP synthase [Oscillospiraceae bacterium]|jgi:tRNA threonylcarbamoyl adenosine modification protein (Sua5/YciO/YrdC/YwlC family)/dephospho-CoA kinase|nr:threonylcarbamoyl-AMP synthase [Oscillospiraceae bacterium]
MRILDSGSDADLQEAGALLRRGEVVAIPTETVYGLAADASNPAAIARIYAIKGRPDNKPLPVLVSGLENAACLCHITPAAHVLTALYWPGPLTLILPADSGTLAVRCPDHPAALAVLRHAGVPLALTSANRSGEPPPSSASQITLTGLGGIVDGGPCAVGRPSAILDLTKDPPELLRHSAAVIGVTGGSGAGKSAVMDRLKELGAATIRADTVYHALLQSNKAMLNELRERFPETFPRLGGPFDRARMREIAFSNPAALTALNHITHPYVLAEIRREMGRVFLDNKDTPVAIEAIALIGSGLDSLCTVKIAVTATFEARIKRVMSRDGLLREEALARLRNQKTDEFYKTNCNMIIENNETAADLFERVDNVWKSHVTS